MVRTRCWICNCKNRECASGKISLYKFPHVNLHFSEEYRQLQKEGCRSSVAPTFDRNTQNIKISMLRICHEQFTTGISTTQRFLLGTYLQLANITRCKRRNSFHSPLPEITGRCKEIQLRSFQNTIYLSVVRVMSDCVGYSNNYYRFAIVGININLIYAFYEKIGEKAVVF